MDGMTQFFLFTMVSLDKVYLNSVLYMLFAVVTDEAETREADKGTTGFAGR